MSDKKLVISENRSSELSLELNSLEDRADALAFASMSKNTQKAYEIDIRQYKVWCKENKIVPFPAEAQFVRLYIAHISKHASPSKVNRSLAAIDKANSFLGSAKVRDDKRVSQVMEGVRRLHSADVPKKASAATAERLNKLLVAIDSSDCASSRKSRDKCILLVMTWGALRSSEAAALLMSDIELVHEKKQVVKVIVHIRRSKTDQTGKGDSVILPATGKALCPVRYLLDWIAVRGPKDGPLFLRIAGSTLQYSGMSAESLSAVFKKYSSIAGLEERLTGHSGRVGFITEAAASGVPVHKIKEQSRHKSVSVLFGYIRDINKGEGLSKLFDTESSSNQGVPDE